MFVVQDVEKLKQAGFKEYKVGYSRKMVGNEFRFLDVNFNDLIVKKVKFVEDHFESELATEQDLRDLIKQEIVVEKLEG